MQFYSIDQHVLKYPATIRIQLLAVFQLHYQALEQRAKKYPVQVTLKGYSAVIDSFSTFTIEGWTNALWNSL